jgi:hypothetical protein
MAKRAKAKKKTSGSDIGETMHKVIDRVRAWPKPLRIGAGLLLIAGGCVGFLPVLGFWMIPAGLVVLAIDIPWLQGPVKRAEAWIARAARRVERWWKRRRARA